VQRGGAITLSSFPTNKQVAGRPSEGFDYDARNDIWNKIVDVNVNYKWILGNWWNNENKYQNYIKFIEGQDILFRLAMTGVYKMLKLSATATQGEIIAAFNSLPNDYIVQNLYELFFDVARVVYLKDPAEMDTAHTKLQMIENEDEFLELLLHPARVESMIMKSIAGACILQKKTPDVLKIIKEAAAPAAPAAAAPAAAPAAAAAVAPGEKTSAKKEKNASITTQFALCHVRALRYAADAQSNAYKLTGKPLRDGFYLSQSVEDFQKMITGTTPTDGFWYLFVKACIEDDGVKSLENLTGPFTVENAAKLAARVFSIYETTEVTKLKEGVFNNLKEKTEVASPAISKDKFPEHAEAMYLTSDARSLNLSNFLTRMNLQYTQFVLHLIATIVRIEKKTLEKINADEEAAAKAEAAAAE